MKRIRSRLPLLLGIVLVVNGCSLLGSGPGAGNDVFIRVENNLIPPSTLSVYAVSELGRRQLVGIARPGETTTLSFSAPGADSYQFAGETTGGLDIVSNSITLAPGATAVWDVSANIVFREDDAD